MLSSEVLAIVYGLASAATWGAGDFSGGLATKRNNVYSVIVVSQLIGVTLLLVSALSFAEPLPPLQVLLWGGLAGIAGAVGLVALYNGLASGRMGIVAPVAAVITAALPVAVGLLIEGLPAPSRLAGFGIALVAVWFLSRVGNGSTLRARELGLPVVAGVSFGLFFILIDQVSDAAVLWPLAAARITSIVMLLVVATARQNRARPAKSQLPVIALAGLFDTGGNTFFALATRVGRLDIAAVLSSLYPTATVLLAWLVLKERLVRQQWAGVVATLVALVLIAA